VSQENVEIVLSYLWAFENDTDSFREIAHPDIEWAPFEADHTPSYGVAGAMGIRNGWLEAWEEHRIDIEEIFDRGDEVLAAIRLTARGRGSGVEVGVPLDLHVKVRDGKVVYVFEHQDRAAALKAVELEE
jgi:ketosteroid isomerase-like protein